jgi:hypothetical protein
MASGGDGLSARRRVRSCSGRCGAGGEGRRLARVVEKVGSGSMGRVVGSVVDGFARLWATMAAWSVSRGLVSVGVGGRGELGVGGGGVASSASPVGSVGVGGGGVADTGSAVASLGVGGGGVAGAGSVVGSVAHRRWRTTRKVGERWCLGLRRRAMAMAAVAGLSRLPWTWGRRLRHGCAAAAAS